MSIELVTQPDSWQMGWEALAAIGALLAVVVMMRAPASESVRRRKSFKSRSGSRVEIKIDFDGPDVLWEIENHSRGDLTGFRSNQVFVSPDGIVETATVSSPEWILKPGEIRRWRESPEIIGREIELPDNPHVQFTDANGEDWKYTVKSRVLERVTSDDDTLPARLSRLLRASRAAFHRLLNRINLEGFEGLLILVILALIGYILWA